MRNSTNALDFFSAWTHASAWAYGLILGDGHVALNEKGGTVMFGGQEDVAWKIHRLLGQGREPFFKGNIYNIYVNSRPLAEWFRARGVMAKKSKCLPWPTDIPEPMMFSFIRGLLDTDGSFTFSTPESLEHNGKGRVLFQVHFCSATHAFITSFLAFIGSTKKPSKSTKVMNGKTFECFSFRLGMADSIDLCRKIYDRDFCYPYIMSGDRYNKFAQGEELWEMYQSGCYICGNPIHTDIVCMEHMWEAKKLARPDIKCADCGEVIDKMGQYYSKGRCCACFHRMKRLQANPNIKQRKRRHSAQRPLVDPETGFFGVTKVSPNP